MSTVRSKDGTTIAFDAYGDGPPPLIMIDGATAYRGVNPTNAEVGQLLGVSFGCTPAIAAAAGRAPTPRRTWWSARSRILPR